MLELKLREKIALSRKSKDRKLGEAFDVLIGRSSLTSDDRKIFPGGEDQIFGPIEFERVYFWPCFTSLGRS